MEKILTSTTKIRFQDCDPFNHLNNSKYIDYFINTREDQILTHYGLDIYRHIKTVGKGWVVASNQVMYIKPALVMEEVLIETQLIHYTSNFLKVEMKMWNQDKTVLKSVFWTTFTYVDIQQQKRTQHSEELTELFVKIVAPVEETVFENRCQAIMQQMKAA